VATPAKQMLSAALTGDVAAVAALLDADPRLCDLADRSPERRSVLHHAAGRGDVAVVELLLAAGAGVDKRSHDGSTPLHAAAAGGHLAVVRVLVAAGADVAARASGGYGPWSAASHHGHRAVADFLRGAQRPAG
jgi:ankyrin repeat protein